MVIARLLVVSAALLLCVATQVDAQGRGRPKGPRAPAGDVAGGPSADRGAAAAPAAAPTFRQFGAWLDDATAPTRGEARLGIGAGYWRSADSSLTDVPIVDLSIGVTDRVQLSASVPFYRSTYAGSTSRGLDDMYVGAKIVAVDAAATDSGFGLAVSPTLEVLSAGYTDDRLHWVLPVSLELRLLPVRIYGSAGYFSRGSAFGGGAVEWATPAGPVITGALTQSVSTAAQDELTRAARTDVSVSLAQALTDTIAGWLSMGRSLASPAGEGTTLGISAGLSVTFSPSPPQP